MKLCFGMFDARLNANAATDYSIYQYIIIYTHLE